MKDETGARRKGVPVFMYHHVSPVPGPYTVHPERFRQQLLWLRNAGYGCLTAPELSNYQRGVAPLPKKAVVLTFDDGWLDNWVYAAPVLQEMGMSGILFVVTSWPGSGEARPLGDPEGLRPVSHEHAMRAVENEQERDSVVMRWAELRAAENSGIFDLQCHSHSHGEWWQSRDEGTILESFRKDLEQSRVSFAHHLGRSPEHYCWPRGQFTRSMRREVARAGFEVEHSTLRGSNVPGSPARLIRRINVEDQPLPWFQRRARFYAHPLLAWLPALMHQHLLTRRLRSQYSARVNNTEFQAPTLGLM